MGAALVLGGLGDALLRATPWGVNFPLWVTALVGTALLLARAGRVRLEGEGRWLAVVALVFATGVVLRDSPVVMLLDVLAVMLALALAVWRGRAGSLRGAASPGTSWVGLGQGPSPRPDPCPWSLPT